MQGNILFAQSSSLKESFVAPKARSAAFRAWTNGSRSERVKAAIKTLDLLPTPRFFEILPKQIVVFVRIPGCSSLEVLARYFKSSPLMVRSDSFPMMVRTALTVCSRTTGATSVNPVTYHLVKNEVWAKKNGRTHHLREYLIIDNLLW